MITIMTRFVMPGGVRCAAFVCLGLSLAACGGAVRDTYKEPSPLEVATVEPASSVADAGAPRVRPNDTPPLMLAMMPKDVACSYANPASRKITLRATPEDGADLITVGPTGMASRLVITATGNEFIELTGIRLRARGYPASDELVASRDIAFGELLVIPRAENVRPAAVSKGKLVINPPVVEGLRFLTPLVAAEVPCDALTMDDVVYEPGPDTTIGSVQLGKKPRELYATPGGPALAVTVPSVDAQDKREHAVIGKQRGFLRLLVNDGHARVVAWVKDAGLKVTPLAQMLDSMRMDMLAQLSSGSMAMGVLSSSAGPAESNPATEVLRKSAHCKESITLLASRIAGGPKKVPIMVLRDVDLRYGEPRGEYVTVDVMSPRDIAPLPGATLEARTVDIDTCTVAE
jgi:hypothetical protein